MRGYCANFLVALLFLLLGITVCTSQEVLKVDPEGSIQESEVVRDEQDVGGLNTDKDPEKTEMMRVDAVCEKYLQEEQKYDFSDLSHWNLTVSGWEKLAERDFDGVFAYTRKCLELYETEALTMAKTMNRFPTTGREDDYALVNDVATARYIMGEAYMLQEKYDEAINEFNVIIEKYPFSLCWDPRGWFWRVAEISEVNLEKIKKIQEEENEKSY